MREITVEYWSDYVCPYCYIGRNRLQKAIVELGAADRVTVVMRSFELDAYAPLSVRCTTEQMFAQKYGLSISAAREKIDQISRMGRDEGLKGMDYAGTSVTNTFDAHRLGKYARCQGIRNLDELLYHAYFCSHRNIGRRDILLELAEQAGLDRGKAKQVLDSGAYGEEVRKEERQAKINGIHLIPHFLFNGTEQVCGVVGADEMREILNRYVKE